MTAADTTNAQAAFAEAAGLTMHTKGMPPLDTPVLAAAITEKLRSERTDRKLAAATRFRCSDAYGCARKIAYSSLGVPKDIEYSPESLVAFRAGDAYHQMAQEAAVKALDARCEWPVDWSGTCSLSGHADAIYTLRALRSILPDDHAVVTELRRRGALADDTVAVEIKSMAGYGFKLAAGTASKSSELPGPKREHLLQCGLYGLAPNVGARWLHIVLIDKDRNLTAEWIIGVEEPLPHLGGTTVRQMVADELERLNAIEATLEAGDLPARDVPGFGRVEITPAHGERGADPWNCAYCSWNGTCAATGEPGPIEGWVTAYLTMKGTAA